MAQDPKVALRSQLSFEQQAQFDALYARQSKRSGTATVFSMPLLGTFGAEQFYLGNVGQGIIRLLFSWTLIPTLLALFEVFSGDIARQVAHANDRVAQRVYREVVANTPTAPAAVRDSVITPSVIAEAATLAASVPFAPVAASPSTSTPVETATEAVVATTTTATDAPPSDAPTNVAEVDTVQHEEATTTTGTFTVTESAAEWNKDMTAPVVTGDEQTMTFSNATDTITDTTVADVVSLPSTATVAPETAPTAAPETQAEDETADATDVNAFDGPSDTAESLASDGVLIFVAEEDPFDTTSEMTDDDVAGLASIDIPETADNAFASADNTTGDLVASTNVPAPVTFMDVEPLVETSTPVATESFVDVGTLTDAAATPAVSMAEATTQAPATEKTPSTVEAPSAAAEEIASVAAESILVVPGEAAAVRETPTETITATTEQQTTEDVMQERIIQADHEGYQHYHNGKLVSASRQDQKMVGEVSSLLDDTTTATQITAIDHSAEPSGWLDAQPLHTQQAQPTAPAHAEVIAPAPRHPDAPVPNDGSGDGSQAGTTDVPGGDVGTAPTSDVPGGAIGDSGTTPTPATGDGGTTTNPEQNHHHPAPHGE